MDAFLGSRPRTAVVTGAGAGLGRALTLELDSRGYEVFGTAILDEEIAEHADLTAGRAVLTYCDITKDADVLRWSAAVDEQLGR